MSAIIAVLYLVCILTLPAFAAFVVIRGPLSHINRLFAWLSLALWLWVVSLFAFNLQISLAATLLVGRLNFAAIVPAMTIGYFFVMAIAKKPVRYASFLWAETALL